MAQTVELNVRSKLSQIAEDLKKISEAGADAQEGMRELGKKVGESHSKSLQKTQNHLSNLRTIGSRIFKSMADDARAMLATIGVSEGLKMGSVFRASIADTFELSDAIRKMAGVFGIASTRFAAFQTRITEGLGDIGLGAESALASLKGLSETQVRGEANLVEYAKVAGQLAAMTGTAGEEGGIAKGIAGVITAQGGTPNDLAAMRGVAEDLRRAYNATGQIPTAILQALQTVVAQMPRDLRKSIGTSGLVQLGSVAATAGPGATKFLEEYLSKSPIARKSMEARGFKGVFGPEGLDIEKFKAAAKGVMDAFPDDPRLMAQTLGLSEDAAEGFVRLYESLDRVGKAQQKMRDDNRSLEQQYRDSMGAAEAFRASLNKVKATFAAPLTMATDFVTEGLKKASETSTGATVAVAGAGLLASTLAGGGIRSLLNLGRGKAVGTAERMAYEQATGRGTDDVYVVNATEIGMAASQGNETMGVLARMSGVVGLLAKAGLVGAAGVGGYAIGGLLNDQLEGTEASKAIDEFLKPGFSALTGGRGAKNAPVSVTTPEGMNAPDVLGRVPQIVTQAGGRTPLMAPPNRNRSQKVDVRVDVNVSTKQKDLKATARPSRGGSQ